MLCKSSLTLLLCFIWSLQSVAAPDFIKDIRPILSDKCFACHGPDEAGQKGGVRLDSLELATRKGKKGAPIVPGDPSQSRLIKRINASDDERMPPPEFKLSLTAEERHLLEEWIQSGAEYVGHWAFQPVEKPDVPEVAGISNPVDAFVSNRLKDAGYSLNDPATKEQLIRRVTFDLTGLPPTLDEVDAFVRDTSPLAFERVVDDLLQRQSFGERMASEWLDVARYSDTYGYQQDRDRRVWPWRDWVVKAFNENLPYSEFARWQIAGDLLPNATEEQILATTFNRLHPQKVEGGSVPEEFRVEYVSDRAQTVATAFLGLTLECSRCHDHKYDPITQADYFSMSSYFDNIDEAGLYSFFTPSVPTPTLLLPDAKQRQALMTQSNLVVKLEKELPALMKKEMAKLTGKKLPEGESGLIGWFDFDPNEKGQVANRAPDGKPIKVGGGNKIVDGVKGKAVQLSGDDEVKLNVGNFKRSQPFSISLWLNTPDVKERAVVFHRSRAWTDAASRGYELLIEEGKLSAALIHFWPGNAIRVKTVKPVLINEWHHVVVTYDGSSKASGFALWLDGKRVETEIVRDHLTKQITGGGGDNISIGARFRDRGFTKAMVDDMRIYGRELGTAEVARLTMGEAGEKPASHELLLASSEPYRNALAALQKAREARDKTLDSIQEIMVMRELPKERPTHVLHRGAYDSPKEQVPSAPPAKLRGFAENAPANRLGLAEWLLARENPLTSRVTVNRYWQMLFGQGLVVTANDFGSQGSLPTHPELLDWLAADFMEQGWDVKGLLRQILLSQTYQQSPHRTDGLVAKDAQNHLLGRSPRYRLPAEMIRDNALKVSGLLVDKQGGAPAKPYEIAVSFKPQKIDTGEGLYRRSLYTYWKRTAPAPVMMTLDAAKRDVCSVKRETTATPLQAFVFMNDPQFVEAANHLAAKTLEAHQGDASKALDSLFRQLLGRAPSNGEVRILELMFKEQKALYEATPKDAEAMLKTGQPIANVEQPKTIVAAMGAVATALMSHDECVMKP